MAFPRGPGRATARSSAPGMASLRKS